MINVFNKRRKDNSFMKKKDSYLKVRESNKNIWLSTQTFLLTFDLFSNCFNINRHILSACANYDGNTTFLSGKSEMFICQMMSWNICSLAKLYRNHYFIITHQQNS